MWIHIGIELADFSQTVDTVLLFYRPFRGKVTAFLDNTVRLMLLELDCYTDRAGTDAGVQFFSFTSAFSWFVLLIEFVWYRDCETSLFPLGGYAAMYLTAEALLFGFRSRPEASLDIYDTTRMIRLGALLILLSVVAISWGTHARPSRRDEENVPLLQDACNRPHYGSTASTACSEGGLSVRNWSNRHVYEYIVRRVKVYTVQLENPEKETNRITSVLPFSYGPGIGRMCYTLG